jgi:hypothetical protein
MNPLRKLISIFVFCNLCLLAAFNSSGQNINDSMSKVPQPELGPNDTIKVPARIIQNEVVPSNTMEWVYVSVPYPPELLKRRQEMTRLRNAVYVTYPYAVRAGFIINDINLKLANMPGRGDRKRYIKTREKELKKEFGDPLTNLSVYQGKVLMKLINRQTGNNCYDILKEYKGGFNARIFQTVAFVFGTNLKQSYDPNGDDRTIEGIVQEVQRLYGKR